jgi:hypothetical protein
MRTILYSTERITANSWEAGLFICFLLVFAVSAAYYVLQHGLAVRAARWLLAARCSWRAQAERGVASAPAADSAIVLVRMLCVCVCARARLAAQHGSDHTSLAAVTIKHTLLPRAPSPCMPPACGRRTPSATASSSS